VRVLGDVALVGDEHDRIALPVKTVEQGHDLGAGGRVKVSGGLVGQQDRRIVDQRPGDGDALPLSAGEFAGLVVHALFEVGEAQGLLGPLDPLLGRHAGIDQRQFDVVQGRGARQQVEGLEDEADLLVADAGQFVVAQVAHQVAVDEVIAFGGRVQAADQVHQRRLARSRRPHDGDILAALDLEVHAGDGMNLLVAHDVRLPQVVGADDDVVPPQLLALGDLVGQCRGCHSFILSLRFAAPCQLSVFAGALLSIFTFAWFLRVRMAL